MALLRVKLQKAPQLNETHTIRPFCVVQISGARARWAWRQSIREFHTLDGRLTKPMSRSLFQTKLAHHSPTLRSVPPPRQYPGPEAGQPRISAPVSHMYRLGGSGNIAPSFNVRRVLVLVLNWSRIQNPSGCRHGCADPVVRTPEGRDLRWRPTTQQFFVVRVK